MTVRALALLILASSIAGCASRPADRDAHARFRPAPGHSRGWVVLLPGSSGLEIFGDDRHYERAAARYNEMGLDALIVDYKGAWHASRDRPRLRTHDKIAWVTARQIRSGREAGELHGPGVLAGWSLGAGGVFRIIDDAERCTELGIVAALAYYPVVPDPPTTRAAVQTIVFQGANDDVTEPRDLHRFLATISGEVELIEFPGAYHGFDVASLPERKTVRLLPLVGPSATFGHDPEAAARAAAAERAFLNFAEP